MLFLFAYITILWLLIIVGGIILVQYVAKIELEDAYLESILKATIALLMVIAWIIIMVKLRDLYAKKRL